MSEVVRKRIKDEMLSSPKLDIEYIEKNILYSSYTVSMYKNSVIRYLSFQRQYKTLNLVLHKYFKGNNKENVDNEFCIYYAFEDLQLCSIEYLLKKIKYSTITIDACLLCLSKYISLRNNDYTTDNKIIKLISILTDYSKQDIKHMFFVNLIKNKAIEAKRYRIVIFIYLKENNIYKHIKNIVFC